MKHPSTPIQAKLISRPNRFLGIVELEGTKVQCFIPNPSRMHELMVPGTKVYLIHRPGDHRKTEYDLTLVEHNNVLVSIDSRLPNYMLREAINKTKLPEFKDYKVERAEPIFEDSRLDLLLKSKFNQIFVEVKSCTLVENKIALFPDSPTKRGARHMKTLIRTKTHGRAAVCFIIQRNDAIKWRPNQWTDPEFTESLRKAVKNGVEVYAYSCEISLEETKISKNIQVNLE